jgi:hypothetical protein
MNSRIHPSHESVSLGELSAGGGESKRNDGDQRGGQDRYGGGDSVLNEAGASMKC